ncbi:MAG: hypothetical protein ACR2PR_11280 [Pseudohongiellaceae bacterium]
MTDTTPARESNDHKEVEMTPMTPIPPTPPMSGDFGVITAGEDKTPKWGDASFGGYVGRVIYYVMFKGGQVAEIVEFAAPEGAVFHLNYNPECRIEMSGNDCNEKSYGKWEVIYEALGSLATCILNDRTDYERVDKEVGYGESTGKNLVMKGEQ